MKNELSSEYEAALAAHNVAFAKFDAVRLEYRALKVGDAEFLNARAVYDKATSAFDAAFELEVSRSH